jgi:hypothetical protein
MSVNERSAYDARTLAEYDAFGPWIQPVRNPDEVPPAFEGYPADWGVVDALKVPRDVARRDVSPGSDLYDHVLLLESDALVVLTLVGGAFDVRRLDYGEIAFASATADLLRGELALASTTGITVRVPFNGAQLDVIERLLRDLNERITGAVFPPRARAVGSLGRPVAPPGDQGLWSHFEELAAADPTLLYVAHHAGRRVTPVGALQRLIATVRPTRLSGMIVARSATQLVALTRAVSLDSSSRPSLSFKHSAMFLHSVTEVRVRPRLAFERLDDVDILAGEGMVQFTVPAGSASGRALAASLAL